MEQNRTEKKRTWSQMGMIVLISMIIGLFFLVFHAMYRSAGENLITVRENEAIYSAEEINAFLSESVDVVKLAAYSLSYMIDSGEKKEVLLDYLVRESKVYTRALDSNFTGLYGVFDGMYLDGIGWVPDEEYDPRERPWYQAAIEAGSEVALVTPYIDSQTGSIMMSISKLLTDRESVISLDIRLDGMQKLFEERVLRDFCSYAMLLDHEGNVVVHSQMSEIGKNYFKEPSTIGNLIVQKLYNTKENYFQIRFDGISYLVFVVKTNNGWYDISVVERKKIFGSLFWIYLAFFISISAICIGIAWAMSRLMNRQFQEEGLDRQFGMLTSIYDSIYVLDLEKDSYRAVKEETENAYSGKKKDRSDAQLALRTAMDNRADERFKKRVFEFTDLSTLGERLEGKQTITREFIDNRNNLCRARFVEDRRDEDGKLKTVYWMLEFVEERKDGGV